MALLKELLEHPELREKPVAVCGNPSTRHGIVLAKNEAAKQAMARQQMAEAMKRFDNVYFIDKADLTGTDHVTSADGTHPSDLGYWRWAQNLQPELLKVLKKHGIR